MNSYDQYLLFKMARDLNRLSAGVALLTSMVCWEEPGPEYKRMYIKVRRPLLMQDWAIKKRNERYSS